MSSFASSGSVVYLAGSFTRLGQPVGQFALVGRRSPLVLGGPVNAVVSDRHGGWFLGGDFVSVAGVRCPRLAHVRADGTLDRRWCVAPSSTVWTVTLAGSILYVGGEFGSIAGRARSAAAAFDAVSGTLLPWHPRFSTSGCGGGEEYAPGGASIYQIAASASTVYIGGCFENVGGWEPNTYAGGSALAAVDAATGKPRRWQPKLPYVGAWTFNPSTGTLFADGLWLKWPAEGSFPDIARQRLAAVDAATGRVKRWYPTPNGDFGITLSGSTLYLAGEFTRVAGVPRRNLAAVDTRTGTVAPWRPDPDGEIDVIVPAGRRVFLAGVSLQRIGSTPVGQLAVVDRTTGRATNWRPDVSGNWVNSIAVSTDEKVAVGFEEGGVKGLARNDLAALDNVTGRISAWDPKLSFVVSLDAVAVSGSTMYIAGDFTRIGGNRRNALAAIDIRTGRLTSWAPKTPYYSWQALAASRGIVYASRPNIDGPTVVSAFDGRSGRLLYSRTFPEQDGAGSSPFIIVGSTLFIGGDSGGAVGALDLASRRVRAFPVGARETVGAFAAKDGTLFVADRRSVLAVDFSTGKTRWRAERFDADVSSMAVSGDALYVGGYFESVDGKARKGLAALDVKTGKLMPWHVEIEGTVKEISALYVAGTRLYVGGDFDGHLATFSVP